MHLYYYILHNIHYTLYISSLHILSLNPQSNLNSQTIWISKALQPPSFMAVSFKLKAQRQMCSVSFLFVFSQPAAPVNPVVTAPQQQPIAAPQPASGGSLDSMLGLLQSDLSRQGVQTSSKGNCSACQKPVVGQVSHQKQLYLSILVILILITRGIGLIDNVYVIKVWNGQLQIWQYVVIKSEIIYIVYYNSLFCLTKCLKFRTKKTVFIKPQL